MSLPKRIKYGVKPVVALVVVRRANSAAGKTSSQLSWSPPSMAALSIVLRSLCILSTRPLPLGLYPVVFVIFIPSAFPTSLKRWLWNCCPQSEWMASGIPKRAKMSFSNVLMMLAAVASRMGNASTH